MGVIVCQTCGKIIDYPEADKMTVWYGVCQGTDCGRNEKRED